MMSQSLSLAISNCYATPILFNASFNKVDPLSNIARQVLHRNISMVELLYFQLFLTLFLEARTGYR